MDLNTILIILGILALVILVAHGLWSSRREKTQFFKNANTFTRDGRIEQTTALSVDKQADPLTAVPIQQANQLHNQEQFLQQTDIINEPQPVQQGLNFDEIHEDTTHPSHIENNAELSLEQQVNEIKITLPQQNKQPQSTDSVYYDMSPSRSVEQTTPTKQEAQSSRYVTNYANTTHYQTNHNENNSSDLAHCSIADIEAALGEESVNLSSPSLREQLAEASLQTTKTTYTEDKDPAVSLNGTNISSQQPEKVETNKEPPTQPQQDFIVLYVVAPENRVFNGTHLAQALEELGFVYSEEGIFNRHLDTLASPVLYSVANIHQPGTFDLHTMADFSTIGVAIFMQLSGTTKDRVNFIYLCQDAKNLADRLNGYVLDENQELFNEQTKTTYLARLN